MVQAKRLRHTTARQMTFDLILVHQYINTVQYCNSLAGGKLASDKIIGKIFGNCLPGKFLDIFLLLLFYNNSAFYEGFFTGSFIRFVTLWENIGAIIRNCLNL